MEFPSSWKKERTENCVVFFSQLSVCLGLGEICFLFNGSYFFYFQPPKRAFLFRFTPWLPRNHTPAWTCCLVFQFCISNIPVLLKVAGYLGLSWNQSFNSQPVNREIPRHTLQHQGVHTLAIMKSRLLYRPFQWRTVSRRVFEQGEILVKVKVKSLSRVRLFATPWTVAYQASPSMGFSRQECWSGLLFLSPGDLPDPETEPWFSTFQVDSLLSEPPGKPNISLSHSKD